KTCGFICGKLILNGYISTHINPSQDVNSYIKEISKTLKNLDIKGWMDVLEIFLYLIISVLFRIFHDIYDKICAISIHF
ncbi:hypothetical protein AB8Y60_15265, partial [Listeria monocytogenes]|uniref:hypothetical protein n=2 Tax=Listeria monocytogenes TaxID=1639 RepID=UPI00350E363D